jgi:glycosyltransferase involved in cell wall biosynthesis
LTNFDSVSVVIPTRNRSRLVTRAIASALNSGTACGEVIVVDDRSTDDTRDVVAAVSDQRVRYFYVESQGGSAARNFGFRAARSDLIKFLDDDDYLIPGGLTRQLAAFRTLSSDSRSHLIVYGDPRVTGQVFSRRSWREIPARRRDGETDVEYLTRVNIQTSCPLHQRRLLDEVGGFDESLRASQENDLHLRLALQGVHFVRIPGDIYVFDNSSRRSRISTQERSHSVVESRFNLLLGRQKMLTSFFEGDLPSSIRRVLARDFRECQRWARQARFDDLEAMSAERAIDLWDSGSLELRFAGLVSYGVVKRLGAKIAKRIRGVFRHRRTN